MKFLTCHGGRLHTDVLSQPVGPRNRAFPTGLEAMDELLPGGAFARGAVHELLALPNHPPPLFVALLIARAALFPLPRPLPPLDCARDRQGEGRSIVWCDLLGTLYPPSIAAMGVPMDRLFLLHPKNLADESWAVAECLRCKGVGATIASPRRLSRIEARRLQLAAERGGGVGILLRPFDRHAGIYAASTRWLVSPHPGERTVQKWKVQLIHGHGGRVGQTIILEHSRETHLVRAIPELADRSVSTETARASA
ncbi:MAG: ImuA family protein [Tepidisphaeraceae bacterium]